MRSVTRAEFAAESGASDDLVERLVACSVIRPRADGTFDARDEVVASTGQALLDAGITIDDLVWALTEGGFGITAIRYLFREPGPRTARTRAELAASLGDAARHLPAIHAALGLPPPEPDERPRADEAEIVGAYAALWHLVDPSGDAVVRVARLVGDATRRINEGLLDAWDDAARPDETSQGAPTVGEAGRPADPADPESNLSVRMAELSRRLVALAQERQLEATLNARVIAAAERVLDAAGRLPRRPVRPPAIAFVDLSGFTTLTEVHGDEAAAHMASRLLALADLAARAEEGRVVKQLGDGVLLHFADAVRALRATAALHAAVNAAGLPIVHAGIAAGPVVVRDGDVFGRTVNLAARLAAVAGPGETLVEEGVVVALPRRTARFEAVGRLELDGFAEPVAVWRAAAQ